MSVSAELSFHILRHSAQKLAEDDLSALADLGFVVEELQAIENLTIGQLNHLSRFGKHFLNVKVNHRRFTESLEHVRHETASQALQNDLLRRRATSAMMRELFGMTPLQYANRRKLLGLSGIGVGRPALPDEDTERAIWEAWWRNAHRSDGERFLATAEETQLPLSTIWPLLYAWETEKSPCCGTDCQTDIDGALPGKPGDAKDVETPDAE